MKKLDDLAMHEGPGPSRPDELLVGWTIKFHRELPNAPACPAMARIDGTLDSLKINGFGPIDVQRPTG